MVGVADRSEQERELRRQLEVAQAISHVGSWEWNLATGVMTWSDELFRIYGLEPQSREITFEFFLSALEPDTRARVQREIEAALQRGGRFTYREHIERPDKETRTLETIGDVVRDAQGAPTIVIGTCRDVTDEARRDETIRFYGDVFAHVQIGLTAWRVAGATLQLIACNPAAEEITQISHARTLGKTLTEVFPDGAAALRALVDDPAARGRNTTVRLGMPAARTVSARVFPLPMQHVGISFEDITTQTRAELIQHGERRALESLARGATLEQIFEDLVAVFEEVCPDTIASILTLDEDAQHLRHGAAPHLPEEYNRAVDGTPIGPTAGSCGTSAFRREPVYVRDIEIDPLWLDYRHLVRGQLRACWSYPILATDGRVLGTFALYQRAPGMPDDFTRDLMSRAAHVAGIAIERRRLDEQLRALTARIEAVREDERTTIARDIHDQLGQALTALKLDVGWLARRVTEPDLSAKLDDMSRAADEVIRSVRRISTELRPSILDDLGLRAAIEWQAEEFTARTGTPCVVHGNGGDLRLDRTLATTVFRIFQEALTNVARHASATHVDVTLGLDRGRMRLEVADDGIGMPEVGPRGSTLGILGMGERARRLGGECTVGRREPRGTIVTLVVPLRFPAEQAVEQG